MLYKVFLLDFSHQQQVAVRFCVKVLMNDY